MEPDPTFQFGMNGNTQAWGGGTGDEKGKVKAATDVRWLREDFLWSLMGAQASGLNFSATTTSSALRPRLACGSCPSSIPPRRRSAPPRDIPLDPASYALLIGKLAARYGPGAPSGPTRPELADYAITHFELWKQPYMPRWAPFRPPQSATRAGARHRERREEREPCGQVPDPGRHDVHADWGTWSPWIPPLFTAIPDFAQFVDAIAVHPYPRASPTITHPRARRAGTYDVSKGWRLRRCSRSREAPVGSGAGLSVARASDGLPSRSRPPTSSCRTR